MDERYLIVSPCRNEANFLRHTLDSVIRQTVQPALWVIVDDGSTDETPDILRWYAGRYNFIKIVTRPDRGHRSVGPGVIEAFYAGLDAVNLDDHSFICKLDLDLELPPRYFEILMQRMAEEPRLGTCSGMAYFIGKLNGNLVSENLGDENSIGASKFYRVSCFKQIGGFVREVMWDGIDCHRCRLLGWIACSWDEEAIRLIHLRPMGSSQKNILIGRLRHGHGQYFMGTDIGYMTASAVYRMTKRPFFIGGMAMWLGYFQSMMAGKKRLHDPVFRKFMRKYQWLCLLKGKKSATELINERRAGYWNPKAASAYSGSKQQAHMDTSFVQNLIHSSRFCSKVNDERGKFCG